MPKKSRSTSTRAAKLRRRARSLAVRPEGQAATDWDATLAACTASIAAGVFRMVCPDGEVRDVTLERMRTHMEADITPDGMEPFGDHATFVHFLAVDLQYGALWLRPDGLWQSNEDYLTDRVAS